MKIIINKGIFRIWIVYAVVAVSIFSYFSWIDHWYKPFEDHYYAYVPSGDFRQICHPCEGIKYLENQSGLLVGFGTDFSQIEKLKRYGGEPEEIGSYNNNFHIYVAIKRDFDSPLIEGKFLPITIQIMEDGQNELLTGQNPRYEKKMENWRESAKEMRAGSNDIWKYLIQDLMSLLAITFVPLLFYSLYMWVRAGFSLEVD